MAVTAVGSSGSSSSTARGDLLRAQHKLAEDLAAKAAEKLAATDKAAVQESAQETLQERQSTSSTLDVIV